MPKTYYAWTEIGDNKEGRKALPASITMSADPGEKHVDARGNVVVLRAPHDVKFAQGVLTTGDPRVIAMLDDIVKNHKDTITDDYEVFLSLTQPSRVVRDRAEQQLKVEAGRSNRLLEELKEKDELIAKLTAKAKKV